MEQPDLAHREEAPPEIGVLTVKFDRRIEAADMNQRLTPHGEIASVPRQRRPAIGVEINQNLARGMAAPRLARDHQAFARLVYHLDVRDRRRHERCLIGACIVDDQNLIGDPARARNGDRPAGSAPRYARRQ